MSHYLEMKGISKNFGAVRALDNVDFELDRNEIMGLVGDNAAGKSTLIKILAGVYRADKGEIHFQGEQVDIQTPLDARNIGIEVVYQDMSLAPNLDVPTNVFLGREIESGLKFVKRREMLERSRAFVSSLGFDIKDYRVKVLSLSGGQQRVVAIARALIFSPKIVVLDEPTAELSATGSNAVIEYVESLRKNNCSVIFITHKLPEVFKIADRITVLRLGKRVALKRKDELTIDEVVKLIVGVQ
jgi:simple sugar transport system ATP-binding protein